MTLILAVTIAAIISSTIDASAIPEPRGRSTCACPRMYDPICASNGITYGNECTFLCAQSKRTELKMVKRDACDSDYSAWQDKAH